jgi:hypothetical protein
MHRQLERIVEEYRAAAARLDRLEAELSEEAWLRAPPAGGWSPAACVEHLNLTAGRFLPALKRALAEAPPLERAGRRLRRDPMGWLLWRIMPPPVRLVRARTGRVFVPAGGAAPRELAERFRQLQQAQLDVVRRADGRAIDRVRIASPFNPKVSYNLYACLTILPRHEQRHLWQAQRAAAAAAGSERAEG